MFDLCDSVSGCEKGQTVWRQRLDVVYFYRTLLLQCLSRLLGQDFYPFSYSLTIFIIVKRSAKPEQPADDVGRRICFSGEVNRDPVSVESPQRKSYCKRQVSGLVFWMNPQVCLCFSEDYTAGISWNCRMANEPNVFSAISPVDPKPGNYRASEVGNDT